MTELESLRAEIDIIDKELVGLLDKRLAVAIEIGKVKKAQNMPIYSPDREEQIFEKVAGHGRVLNKEELRVIYTAILTVMKDKISSPSEFLLDKAY